MKLLMHRSTSSRLFSFPLVFRPYIVASSSSGIRRLQTSSHSPHYEIVYSWEKWKKFDLIFLPSSVVVRSAFYPSCERFLFFFVAMSFHSRWKQKSSSGGKSSFILHRSFVTSTSIVKELKFSIKNPIWGISFFLISQSSKFNFNQPKLGANSMSNMNIEEKSDDKEGKKMCKKSFPFYKKKSSETQPKEEGWS